MYYRYKSKKRSGQKLKIIGIALAVVVVLYPLYHFRDHLQFWKYSFNKIVSQVQKAEGISDKAAKKAAFQKAIAMCDDYEESHPFSRDAYYLEARADFLLGEADSGADFTSFVIDNKKTALTDEERGCFQKSIQNISKGICFDQRSHPDDEVLLVLAKSYFYLDYCSADEVKRVLDLIRNPSALSRVDDRRFFGLVKITGGDPEGGVRFLVDFAEIQKDPTGRLFLASVYSLAKQYTNAIFEYKTIIESSQDQAFLTRARMGIGRVYLTQSLAREALAKFSEVLTSDPQNDSAKLWAARSYLAMNDKVSAKKMCAEVLAKNPQDTEALELSKGL